MLDPDTAAQLTAGAIAPTEALDTIVRLILVQSESNVAFEAGVGLFMLPETAAAKPGFAVLPYGTAGIQQGVNLSDTLRLAFEGTLQLDGGIGALVRPGKGIELMTGFGPGTPSAASGTVSIALRMGKEGEPTVILGTADASHFELIGSSALGGARFHSGGNYEVFVELEVQGAKIVIKPGADESDSFLATLLPGDGLSIGTDLTVGFSTTQGLYFGGSGGRCSPLSSRTSDSRRRSLSPRTGRATSDRPTWPSASSRRMASDWLSTRASSRAAAISTSTSTRASTRARLS
jgi:hypothetical protein